MTTKSNLLRKLANRSKINQMTIDAKRLLAEIAKKDRGRGTATIYVHKSLFQEFKSVCKQAKVSSNSVLEKLIEDFVKSAKKSDK